MVSHTGAVASAVEWPSSDQNTAVYVLKFFGQNIDPNLSFHCYLKWVDWFCSFADIIISPI